LGFVLDYSSGDCWQWLALRLRSQICTQEPCLSRSPAWPELKVQETIGARLPFGFGPEVTRSCRAPTPCYAPQLPHALNAPLSSTISTGAPLPNPQVGST